MEERVIKISIDPKGTKLKVETSGYQGVGCKAVAEVFDCMGKTTEFEEKSEIYDNYNQNTITTGRY